MLTLSWINATATVLPVPTNLTTTVRLLGLWVSRNLTVSVKLASTFWVCPHRRGRACPRQRPTLLIVAPAVSFLLDYA